MSVSAYAQLTEEVPEKKKMAKNSYLGIGLGLPYGWCGANIESHIYKKLFLSLGGGIIFDFLNNNYVAPVLNIGPSIHLSSGDRTYQPAFMLLYGSNGYFVSEDYYRDFSYQVYNGVTFGLSNTFLVGEEHNNGFSFDFLAIVSSKLFREHPEVNPNQRFKIGLAYKHKFRYK